MKYTAIFSFALAMCMACSCLGSDVEEVKRPSGSGSQTPAETIVYHERAKETFDMINRLYKVTTGPTAGFYNENYPKGSGDNSASFLWPFDGLVTGVGMLHELGYDVDYPALVDKFEAYWYERNGIGGYGSQTNGTSGMGDRFYDDNSIVGLDLVEAYRLTHDTKYLDRARRIIDFLKSGEDNQFGGGLWWCESLKNNTSSSDSNKPCCANSYATLFLLNYYSVCPQSEKAGVLAFAKRLYNWLDSNLKDPEDKCFWNDIQAKDGKPNKTKWTYNSGAMISNGVLLYRYTGEQKYLDFAKETTLGSGDEFIRPTYPDHDPWFTIKLVNAYMDIEPYYKAATGYINTFINFMDNAWENAREESGQFWEDWTGASIKRKEQLLMQSAALESLGAIALYKKEKYQADNQN